MNAFLRFLTVVSAGPAFLYLTLTRAPKSKPAPSFAEKCKRRRTDGTTPCLCCSGECQG